MEKWIPFEKLSKKKQRELNAKRRGSWHGFNPVTRKPAPSKAYQRHKARSWKNDLPEPCLVCCGAAVRARFEAAYCSASSAQRAIARQRNSAQPLTARS